MRPLLDLSTAEMFRSCHATVPGLRIGILVAGGTLSRCDAAVVGDLRASSFVAALTVYSTASPTDAGLQGLNSRGIAARAYERLIDSRHVRQPNPLERVPLRDAIGALPVVALDQQATANLDVALDLTGDPTLNLALGARFGVWRLVYDANQTCLSPHPFAAPVLSGEAVTRVRLLARLATHQRELVLLSSEFSTCAVPSASRNAFAPCWVSHSFFIMKLRELAMNGWNSVVASVPSEDTYPVLPPRRSISASSLIRCFARRAYRRARERYKDFRRDYVWQIGLRQSTTPYFADARAININDFRWLSTPRGVFWADPFLVERDGVCWLFFEEMDASVGRGVLRCGRVTPENELRDICTVLEQPFHLSYPHIFEDDGCWYMVPESEESSSIDLYKCREFPSRWEFVRTLLPIRAVDTTIFEHQGKWWMFVTPTMVRGSAAVTVLYSADSLLGEWRPCVGATVSFDVRTARGAGRVFAHDGMLVRPSQNCSVSYGHSLVFNEITTLSRDAYCERRITEIEPVGHPHIRGVHSYSRAGRFEAIDVNFALRRLAHHRDT